MGEDNIWLQGRRREGSRARGHHHHAGNQLGTEPGPAAGHGTPAPARGPRCRRDRPHRHAAARAAGPARRKTGVTASRPGNPANLTKQPPPGPPPPPPALTRRWRDAAHRPAITFRGLAQPPVSLDFLYRNPALRQRSSICATGSRPAPAPAGNPATPVRLSPATSSPRSPASSPSSKTATARKSPSCNRALETAHGENLILRRRLGQQQQQPARRFISNKPMAATSHRRHRRVRSGTTCAMSNFFIFVPRITSEGWRRYVEAPARERPGQLTPGQLKRLGRHGPGTVRRGPARLARQFRDLADPSAGRRARRA